jgi:hypothetical protein
MGRTVFVFGVVNAAFEYGKKRRHESGLALVHLKPFLNGRPPRSKSQKLDESKNTGALHPCIDISWVLNYQVGKKGNNVLARLSAANARDVEYKSQGRIDTNHATMILSLVRLDDKVAVSVPCLSDLPPHAISNIHQTCRWKVPRRTRSGTQNKTPPTLRIAL